MDGSCFLNKSIIIYLLKCGHEIRLELFFLYFVCVSESIKDHSSLLLQSFFPFQPSLGKCFGQLADVTCLSYFIFKMKVMNSAYHMSLGCCEIQMGQDVCVKALGKFRVMSK